jgi:hypothetical protein
MKKMAMLLLSLAVLGGCAMAGAESEDGVTLTAARTGSKVLLTLRNNSAAPVGYNLCSSELQRGAAWEPVETGDICTMEIRMLERGGSATFEKTLASDLGSASTGMSRIPTRKGSASSSRAIRSVSSSVGQET